MVLDLYGFTVGFNAISNVNSQWHFIHTGDKTVKADKFPCMRILHCGIWIHVKLVSVENQSTIVTKSEGRFIHLV